MKAYYTDKPSTFAAVGNGSTLYRWHIASSEHWECEEVTVWHPLDKKKVVAAVINESWSANHEQKLVNEYNSAIVGIYEGDEAQEKIQAYKDFLSERKALKASVEKDCEDNGII